MKFSEMPYERPDIEAAKANLAARTEELKNAADFETAEKIFLEVDRESGEVETLITIANIRHDIDTNDEFYDKEVEYLDNVLPELQEYTQKWTLAMLSSPFRPQFEEKYGKLLFINDEMRLKTFSPEIIPELQRENALTTEYSKLIASAQIPFEGETYTLSQLTPIKQCADDARRLAAWKAEGGFYRDNREKFDSIYDELTHLRDTMGRKLGFDGYTELGYLRMSRNCYDKNDVEKFRKAVREFLVPVANEVFKKQAARLGKTYPMNFADNALAFRSGNPKPQGTPDDILAAGRKFYHELSAETTEFIDVMYENELLDVLSKKGKTGGGYCTGLPKYKVPFIFANFNGTAGDVEVMTHEAGHAFAAYLAKDIVPLAYSWPSLEACEVHSMSMEFFSWPWAEEFFGKDAKKFYYTHLSDALTFIPYGTMVDHFQHIVYERPDMTPEERHGVWKELLGTYMPWMALGDDIPFYGEGKGWQRQMHIYQSPFYYIDYCLAQTMALQFWALIQKDRKAAWDTYMKYTCPAGTMTFRELIEEAGLKSPFGDEALSTVCSAAREWLDNYDISEIE